MGLCHPKRVFWRSTHPRNVCANVYTRERERENERERKYESESETEEAREGRRGRVRVRAREKKRERESGREKPRERERARESEKERERERNSARDSAGANKRENMREVHWQIESILCVGQCARFLQICVRFLHIVSMICATQFAENMHMRMRISANCVYGLCVSGARVYTPIGVCLSHVCPFPCAYMYMGT